jgi:hypothetical protein
MIESRLKSFRLPQELMKRLGDRAKEDGSSVSKVIVQAVTQFLDGPNGPKGYSAISPELIEFGRKIQEGVLKDVRGLLFPQRSGYGTPMRYTAQEVLVEPTPETLNLVDAFTVVQEEVPIGEIKEKVSRGTCKACGAMNDQHYKDCSKRKK